MKTGKYLPLGVYQNIKIGYGTVDYKELKTVYIKCKSWILPLDESDYDYLISRTIKKIKTHIFNLNNDYFHKECIVDLNIKTSSIKVDKKSFMDLEITLYTKNQFNIKDDEVKKIISDTINDIIDNDFEDKKFYNFSENKK